MSWKNGANRLLRRATGYQIERARPLGARAAPRLSVRPGDRLVDAPVFVLCTLRSGSTLLRVLLNSHSQLHAPHELHLGYVSVQLDRKWSERSMRELGLDVERLEYLLWDRLLHRELSGSGKPTIVDKTPNNVFIAERLRKCWPDARFLFLLRHPAAIARSRIALRKGELDPERNAELIRRYCDALESARGAFDGHTVRYEELTADPERVLRGICDFLAIPWEPGMLDYGRHDHGRFRPGLGDWSDKLKTGSIQAPEPLPAAAEVHPALHRACRAWGYLPSSSSSVSQSGPTASIE